MSLMTRKKKPRAGGYEVTGPDRWLRRGFEDLFDRFWNSPFSAELAAWPEDGERLLAVDVSESDTDLKIEMDLPGVEEKDLDISVSGNLLVVKGERKEEQEEKKRNYYRVERSFGSFSRSIDLPPTVDVDKIDALFKNGVLSVTIPKKPEAKSTKIEVKAV